MLEKGDIPTIEAIRSQKPITAEDIKRKAKEREEQQKELQEQLENYRRIWGSSYEDGITTYFGWF